MQTDIGNFGTASVPSGISLLAFYDANHNGLYDPDADLALGHATASAAVEPQATNQIDIPVSGILPFRDAPVSVWVDSAMSVVEVDEENNYGSSRSQCQLRIRLWISSPS